MWKAERFEDTPTQSALDQMLAFVNTRALAQIREGLRIWAWGGMTRR